MNKLKIVLFIMLTSFLVIGKAQNKATISGTIKESSSGELIFGANISVVNKGDITIVSNEYGFYSLTLDTGYYKLRIFKKGYIDEMDSFYLKFDINKNYEISDEFKNQVVVRATKKNDNLTKPQMGTETINIKEISKIPVIFGEKDLVKTAQLLPGFKSAGEGGNGFSVRGGGTDQNLILLDEAPVYNASHLLGFFSTFNSDAIKDVTIIKGNSPSQYGGRLASVLDVKMKEGNNKNYNLSGGIGLISSRLTVEGPIQKNKSSFIISGRRTYADLFLKATKDFNETKLYFYDLNAKGNIEINKNNKLYFSGYFGKDILGIGSNFNTNWGNTTGTLRWNSIINPKLFSNTSLIYSNFDYNIGISAGATEFNINSHITDINLKQDFTYFANSKNSWRFGFNAIHHKIKPSTFSGSGVGEDEKDAREGLENAIYFSNLYKPTKKLSIEYGLRGSSYTVLGGTTYNIYTKGVKTDSVVLAKGEFGKTYYFLEPRFTANYRLSEMKSVKIGYARNTQNLHLMSNSTGGNPTDQWLGNSYNTKPEISDQVSIGYSQNFNKNNYELNLESYYKNMQNQVDYKDGADINTVPDVESELLYGQGRAYGFELSFKKKNGNFTGWISYTLSKTERKIEGINNNEWYNAKLDRTHDIALVGMYQISKSWNISGTFVYNTGNAVTFPTGKYTLNGNTVYQYAARNANRMPAYHRMDLGATYEKQRKGKFQSSWNFSLYNVYGRQNAYTITFRDKENDPTKTETVQTSLFRWVPSVTYNFKF